jgi:hypothetical protein
MFYHHHHLIIIVISIVTLPGSNSRIIADVTGSARNNPAYPHSPSMWESTWIATHECPRRAPYVIISSSSRLSYPQRISSPGVPRCHRRRTRASPAGWRTRSPCLFSWYHHHHHHHHHHRQTPSSDCRVTKPPISSINAWSAALYGTTPPTAPQSLTWITTPRRTRRPE